MEQVNVRVSPSLRRIARIAFFRLEGVSGGPDPAELDGLWQAQREALRRDLGGAEPSDLPGFRRNRLLWGAFGLDPTRDRPVPERLLRLDRSGRTPRGACGLEDLVLLVSARHQCPLEAYDLDALAPPFTVRIAAPTGAAGSSAPVPASPSLPAGLGGRPVLADRNGVFGSPGRRPAGARTSASTTRALIVAWLTPDHPRRELDRALGDLLQLARRHSGARPLCPRVPEQVVCA